MDGYTSSRDPRRAKRPRSENTDFSSNRRASPSPDRRAIVKGEHTSSARLPPPPFDQVSADTILRTIDSVDFRVKSAILVEASEHFRAWFGESAPPRRSRNNARDYDSDNLPIIRVVENSELLNILLRFCYPVEEPCIKSSLVLCEAIVASKRYEMHCAEQRLFRIFDTHSEKDPLKMYMLACRYKLPKGIASAARATLNRPIQILDVARLENISENEFISGTELIRLQAYHKTCGQAASSVIGAIYAYTADLTSNELKLPWLPMGEWTWFTCQHNNSVSATEMVIIQNNVELPAAKWWTNYLRKAQEKLRNRPTGAAVQDMKPFSAFAAAATDHCGLCKRHVISDLHTFNNLLAHQVERAVSEVEFDPKPEVRPPGSALATTPW